MTTPATPNGTAPAPTFTEAPASINVRVVSPAGFDYLLTMRASRVGDVLNQAQDLEKWLLSHSWTPAPTRAQGNGQAAQTAQGQGEAAPLCDRCQQPMKRRTTRDGTRSFWSCSTRFASGQWCQGKPQQDGPR